MKKLLYIFTVVFAFWGMASCSSEDEEAVSIHDPNAFFAPADNDDSEEAQIRRQFKSKYNAYLLFNDTLQKKFNGIDVNGDSVFWVELLSLNYTTAQVSYHSEKYTYDYLASLEERKEALAFLEEEILSHISGKLMPYSWFLCSQINFDDGSTSNHPYAAAGQRAIVIATGLLPRLKTEAQRKQFINRVLIGMMGQLVANNISAFDDFFEVSKGYYGINFTASSDAVAQNYCRSHGFLDKSSSVWGGYATPSETADLSTFSTYVLTYDDEYIEKQYVNYPLVLKKWYIFKDVLKSLGYKF